VERSHIARRALAVSALLFTVPSCRAAIDEPTYRCTLPTEFPFVETFDGDVGELQDRCWETRDAQSSALFTDDGDLVIRPEAPASWAPGESAPSLTQAIEGDFVVITRAEPVNVLQGDHCRLGESEVAGLVADRDTEPAGWLTLTVRPTGVTPENCVDEAPDPPRAIVERTVYGFGLSGDASAPTAKDGVGEDGEADVALCRLGNVLASYTRNVASTVDASVATNAAWTLVRDDDVGPGALHVGVTAARGNVSMEGHFNWVVFQRIGRLGSDGCEGELANFTEPAER
jgi:hypothetical protein